MFPVSGSLLATPPFPRLGPGESGSPTSKVLRGRYDFPSTHLRSLICFASGAHAIPPCFVFAVVSAPGQVEDTASGQDHCSTGDPIAGVLSRGREWDLSGSQATHPVLLPRSKTPAEPAFPRQWRDRQCCPCCRHSKGFSVAHIGANAGLRHQLSTLQERCCHRPCKTRFRLAGWPLPGGS